MCVRINMYMCRQVAISVVDNLLLVHSLGLMDLLSSAKLDLVPRYTRAGRGFQAGVAYSYGFAAEVENEVARWQTWRLVVSSFLGRDSWAAAARRTQGLIETGATPPARGAFTWHCYREVLGGHGGFWPSATRAGLRNSNQSFRASRARVGAFRRAVASNLLGAAAASTSPPPSVLFILRRSTRCIANEQALTAHYTRAHSQALRPQQCSIAIGPP